MHFLQVEERVPAQFQEANLTGQYGEKRERERERIQDLIL